MTRISITLEVVVHDEAALIRAGQEALESRGADYTVADDDLGALAIEAILYDDSDLSYEERGFEMASVEATW